MIALKSASLPTVETFNPLAFNLDSTNLTAGLAQVGVTPSSIPANKLSNCADTKASSGMLL